MRVRGLLVPWGVAASNVLRCAHERYGRHDDVALDEFVRQWIVDRRLRHARASEKGLPKPRLTGQAAPRNR